jgi:hypothetical protein
MGNFHIKLLLAALLPAVSASAVCQSTPDQPVAQVPANQAPAAQPSGPQTSTSATPDAPQSPGPQIIAPQKSDLSALLNFKDSDVKFSVAELIDILSDSRHEGWVLTAYPDPKTARPLIGAGFSLDLPARSHEQTDLLNPNIFVEPSSAELWHAAGLDGARLTEILGEFNQRMSAWSTRDFRRDLRELPPEISENDAKLLVRIGIIQSIVNARAYCRGFDNLTASQQMALSQLVYQMGVNLEEFTEFRSLINHEPLPGDSTASPEVRDVALRAANATASAGATYWKAVQQSLEQSQWARLYRARAVAVIAMLDPRYAENPSMAERRVSAVLRPVSHRRRARATTQLAASHNPHAGTSHGKSARSRRKKA